MQSAKSAGGTQTETRVHHQSTLKYPHRLNFYDSPPSDDITLEDFESYAIDRLRVLAEIESCWVRNRSHEELKVTTKAHCNKYLELHNNSAHLTPLDAERKKDHIGHFVLRLAFCRSEELRRRFVKAETMLFRIRFEDDDATERPAFLNSRDFGWEMVSPEEKKALKQQLEITTPSSSITNDQWYKVRWTRVPDLIERRRVFLKKGWAYVPAREQSSIVFQEFQTRLEEALEKTAKALPRLDEDTRIMPILSHLGQGFLSGVGIASEYTSSEGLGDGEELKADMIDDMARKHWPLCMRHLHDSLKKDRHLKHFGRLQYGLFIKVVGLPVEEALVFWRKAFGGTLTDDKFNKEYKYNIRHSYGLEGRRMNYPASSCQKIITTNQPGPTDCHGCPYRHFSSERLQTTLLATYGSQGLTISDLPEIVSAVKASHFHVACTKVFEVTHAIPRGQGLDSESVTHPNQYAAKSRDIEKAKESNTKKEQEAMVE